MMGQPVVDLFASSRTFKVNKYYSMDLTDRRAIGSDGAREKWLPGLRYAFLPPPMIQLMLGQLKLKGRELNTDHSILAGPVLVDGRHTPKVIQATQVATKRM